MGVLGFLGTILFVGLGAFAGHHNDLKGQCHKEMKELCKDKMGRELWACAKENVTKLSPECQKKIAEKKEKWHEHREACREDREKFCKDVKPGRGRVIECLRKNMGQVSEACKAQMNQEPHRDADSGADVP